MNTTTKLAWKENTANTKTDDERCLERERCSEKKIPDRSLSLLLWHQQNNAYEDTWNSFAPSTGIIIGIDFVEISFSRYTLIWRNRQKRQWEYQSPSLKSGISSLHQLCHLKENHGWLVKWIRRRTDWTSIWQLDIRWSCHFRYLFSW